MNRRRKELLEAALTAELRSTALAPYGPWDTVEVRGISGSPGKAWATIERGGWGVMTGFYVPDLRRSTGVGVVMYALALSLVRLWLSNPPVVRPDEALY